MPSSLGRNLNLCFTKIKRPLLTLQSPPLDDDHPSPPTTTSTATAATSSSSSLIKNFNSLYDGDFFDSATTTSLKSSDLSTSDTDTTTAAADFATVFASQRFFFSSPGRSNSIVDQSSSSASSSSSDLHAPFKHNSVVVPTYSPDPYLDFRRSMQEMVEARAHQTQDESVKAKSNWEFLHELLLCYLALNPKSTHKFIIGAFSDLLVSRGGAIHRPWMALAPPKFCKAKHIWCYRVHNQYVEMKNLHVWHPFICQRCGARVPQAEPVMETQTLSRSPAGQDLRDKTGLSHDSRRIITELISRIESHTH